MSKRKHPMDNVIRFPTEKLSRFGLERVRKRKESRLERYGQMNLFTDGKGEVLSLPSRMGPFDEALLLDERGDREAAETYRRAIEAGDCVADAYCNLGVMESRRGNSALAFDCFKGALKEDPRHFESHYNLGNLYFDAGDMRPARLHYEVAAELDPEFPNVYFNLGVVDAMSGEYQAAIEALSKYKELAAEDEAQKADELLASLKRSMQQPS